MDKKPKYEKVPTGRLKIDPAYQRRLNVQRIEKMADDWDEQQAGAFYVSRRNDGDYVFDGQHRLAAARRLGPQIVPTVDCLVYEGLAPADEARLFVLKNTTTKRPVGEDIFRAKLEAGDPDAVSVVSTLNALGVEIAWTHGAAKAPHRTRAMVTLGRIHSVGGPTLVRDAVTVCRTAWPTSPKALENYPLFAVAGFIHVFRTHPTFDLMRLSRKLSEQPLTGFVQRMGELAGASGVNTGADKMVKPGPLRAAIEAWNRNLAADKRLEYPTLAQFRQLVVGRNPWTEVE